VRSTKLLVGIVMAAGLAFSYAQQNGGSDYYFWDPNHGYTGVLTEYNLCLGTTPRGGCLAASEHILENITQMAANGQQILFLPIFFADNGLGPNANCPSGLGAPNQGVIVNSTNGVWPSACLSALESIISWANAKGMRVGIAFYPANNNFPGNWSTYDSFHANQNWQFIYNTHVALSNHCCPN